MQNTVRWRSNWLDGAVVGRFSGIPWSNESDANVEDSDCTVQMLLFFSINSQFTNLNFPISHFATYPNFHYRIATEFQIPKGSKEVTLFHSFVHIRVEKYLKHMVPLRF
jgi:hypothetical protein